ncbi:clavesin-1 [Condylostylus longicornis]|uniref:clavesin-1 n=1 Tax=Condylostylus longicornis TaxID=2530218 RepID=UPI00244E55C8|nr:clavesin-1 [Condylostylus longicornis]XP_055375739.1 clavesin-1 [Condylostylus longicornis]
MSENSEECFNLRIGYLRPETVELAKNELRETPEVKQAAIEELRQLLHEATDLHYRDDDEFLTIWLRACHFYPKSAIEKMRSTAEFRKENAALVRGLMPEMEKDAFCNHQVVNVLKNCDHKGRRILIVNVGKLWNPSAVSSDQMFRLFYLIHIAAQLEPETQCRGVVVIMDFDGLGMSQVKSLTPSFSKRLLTFIQDAMPIRMKEVHIVKQPFIFKMVWPLFKPFIREKLGKRIWFHGGNMKTLHEYLDPAYLPENYGGTLPAINYGGNDWYPVIEKYEDFVRQWGEFGFAKW